MNNLAIIPARSGSKGLKDKNIKLLNGKPLIAYTIEAALKSKIFDEIMVSTDSIEYAKIAQQYGANVPFLRTNKLSGDNASSWDVVREVLYNYQQRNIFFKNCILLQPTSPLRTENHIIDAMRLYHKKRAKAVISVCETLHPAQWCFKLGDDNNMDSFCKSPYKNLRRQELPKTYYENGAIYIVDANEIQNREFDIYESQCFAYIMNYSSSLDIDNQEDFELVKFYLKEK